MTQEDSSKHTSQVPPLCHMAADWETWPSEEVGENDDTPVRLVSSWLSALNLTVAAASSSSGPAPSVPPSAPKPCVFEWFQEHVSLPSVDFHTFFSREGEDALHSSKDEVRPAAAITSWQNEITSTVTHIDLDDVDRATPANAVDLLLNAEPLIPSAAAEHEANTQYNFEAAEIAGQMEDAESFVPGWTVDGGDLW